MDLGIVINPPFQIYKSTLLNYQNSKKPSHVFSRWTRFIQCRRHWFLPEFQPSQCQGDKKNVKLYRCKWNLIKRQWVHHAYKCQCYRLLNPSFANHIKTTQTRKQTKILTVASIKHLNGEYIQVRYTAFFLWTLIHSNINLYIRHMSYSMPR